jgi:uncharacterized protein (DUF983 family)
METTVTAGMPAPQDTAERPTGTAVLRGLRKLCPACGKGHLFDGYLRTADHCDVCSQKISGHRADDGPAYLTILVVGHILAPVILFIFETFRPDPLLLASILTIGTVALALFLLPRMKGLVIGVQWAKRMHGFGEGA